MILMKMIWIRAMIKTRLVHHLLQSPPPTTTLSTLPTPFPTLRHTYSSLAKGLALGLSIWLVAMGPWRVRRVRKGERKKDEG